MVLYEDIQDIWKTWIQSRILSYYNKDLVYCPLGKCIMINCITFTILLLILRCKSNQTGEEIHAFFFLV